MEKKQKRQKIIRFWLLINQFQQEVQRNQVLLVSHPSFNPEALFKKISEDSHFMKIGKLKKYLENRLKNCQYVDLYFLKHSFQENISFQDFSLSLIPYVPNILRIANQQIEDQMTHKKLNQEIEAIYLELVEIQLNAIYNLNIVQHQMGLSWQNFKRIIKNDLNKYLKKIDIVRFQNINIFSIRKWLQIWIDIDEQKILNMMRWLGGGQENIIKKWFQKIDHLHLIVKCKCENNKSECSQNKIKRIKSEKKSFQKLQRKNVKDY